MKKKALISGIAIVVFLAGAGVLLYVNQLTQSPEYLLRKLARADNEAERDDLVMRLSVARGNVVDAVLDAYNKPDAKPKFRADLLDLLFKWNLRARQDRIDLALRAALTDREAVVRRKAAQCIALCDEEDLQAALADLVDDPDAQVRRQGELGERVAYREA